MYRSRAVTSLTLNSNMTSNGKYNKGSHSGCFKLVTVHGNVTQCNYISISSILPQRAQSVLTVDGQFLINYSHPT
jgi:pyruvoyl-dependent arginine decarboxylase (PvlArgDC)